MHRQLIVYALALFLSVAVVSPALAADCISKYMPSAREVGSGEGRRFVFHAYDASLRAPDGVYHQDKPFALTLQYHMSFSGEAIARESIAQMRRMGGHSAEQLLRWQAQLDNIFPDVTPGMAITGLRLKSGKTIFCTPAGELGRVADPAFGDAFFAIWLSDKAESQTLRRQLTGQT